MTQIDPQDFAFGEDRFAWRLNTLEGVTWRLATRDDMPRLQELWDEMDAKLGKQDRPNLMQMPVLITLVAVDDVTGRIEAATYGECVVDWTMIGTSRRVARTIKDLHPYLVIFLFTRAIRVSRILVPKRLEKHMQRLMPQMRNITHLFAQFACMIRP
jgi:hypothetical protein